MKLAMSASVRATVRWCAPVSYTHLTLSPKLHRLLAEQLGEQIEYSICAIPPEELEEHFEELFCMDGFNITIPYKVRLMEQLDRLDTSARNHGVVNVVSIAADGKRCGYNTDCIGFVRTCLLYTSRCV